jgi:hypothetical protein
MWRSNSISKPRMRPPPIPSNDVASSVNGIHTFQSLSILAEQIGAAEIRQLGAICFVSCEYATGERHGLAQQLHMQFTTRELRKVGKRRRRAE